MQLYPKFNNNDTPQSVRFQQILFWGFFYTILGGVIRKWVFGPGLFSNIILLGHLFLPLLVAWQCSKIKINKKNPYKPILVVFFLILCLMASNPLNHTIMHGILGIIIHFGFWCLLFVYLQYADSISIKQLDACLLILLIIETILASIQYNLQGDHILNRYVTGEENSAMVGDALRTSGTFSYLGGFGAMITFYGFYSWSLLRRNVKPILFFISMSLTLYLALLSGSRGVAFTVLILIAMGIIENRSKLKAYIPQAIAIGIVLIFVSILFANPFRQVDRALDNFVDRTKSMNEIGETAPRIDDAIFSAFRYHGSQPLTGAGLGATYQGAVKLFGMSDTYKEYGYMEAEPVRIVFEGGYILYLLRIGFFILVLSAMKIARWEKIMLFCLFVNGMIVFNTFMTFFLAMGLIWINRNKTDSSVTSQ
jgi:hypothetical protein